MRGLTRRLALCGALLGLVAALPARALAQPRALQLAWQAPEGCPGEADARAAAEAALGPDVSSPEPLVARATVERREGVYRLELFTLHHGEQGRRTLEAHDCRALLQSVTLVLGVLLGVEPASPAAITPLQAEPAAAPAAIAPVEATPPAAASEPAPAALPGTHGAEALSFGLSLGPSVQLGLTPAPALGATLGLELRIENVLLGARVEAFREPEQHTADGLSTQLDGLEGDLFAGYRWAAWSAALGLLGGARAAALRGRAQGPQAEPGSAVAPWYALFVGADFTWPRAAPLGLHVWADAAASLVRPRFTVGGLGTVQHVPVVVGQLGLGVVWSP